MRCCSGIVRCCCYYPLWKRVIRIFYHDDRNTSFPFFKNKSFVGWLIGWLVERESDSFRAMVELYAAGRGGRGGGEGGERDYPS